MKAAMKFARVQFRHASLAHLCPHTEGTSTNYSPVDKSHLYLAVDSK